jgi:hypothetical protein
MIIVMRGRIASCLSATAFAAALYAPSPSPAAPNAKRCDRYHSPAAGEARLIARSALVAAETYGTDHSGEYIGLSLAKLHAIEPWFPITRRRALHEGGGAYLFSAKASRATYLVTARTLNGDTYTIERRSDGTIERTGRECGRIVHW